MSSKLLRGFRKEKEKEKEKSQSSILRYIRHVEKSPKDKSSVNTVADDSKNLQKEDNNSKETSNDSTLVSPVLKVKNNSLQENRACSNIKILNNELPSSTISFRKSPKETYVTGCTSTSPNKINEPPQGAKLSKLFYISPKPLVATKEDNKPIIDAKVSGFDISAVLKDATPSSSQNGHCSLDSLEESSPCGAGSQMKAKKRMRITSDDEDEDNECNAETKLSKKPCMRDEPDSTEDMNNGKSRKFDDDMIEKLLETYSGLYPSVDRMELYDIMERLEYNFSEVTFFLDNMEKEKKNMKKQELSKLKQLEKEQLKISKTEEKFRERIRIKNDVRDLLKHKKALEKEKKKQMWKLKAQGNLQEDEDDDEDDYIGKTKVYQSDSSEDEDQDTESEATLNARNLVFNFFNEASTNELSSIPGCSKKKCDIILQCRPFENWQDLVFKFKSQCHISTELLNLAKDVIQMRNSIQRLMKQCERISSEIKNTVSQIIDGNVEDGISKQPVNLNPKLKLKNYQLIGLNWIVLMHEQQLNGVLADEMGLGKTIQAISFLAYLKENEELEDSMCLIVVPTSTLDNWARELKLWCPSLGFLVYHGSQEERKGMRMAIVNNDLDEDTYIILTTYNMVASSTEDRGLFKKFKFHTVIFDEAHMLKNMASQRYENLMKIKCKRRLLLTGTPLQNNLVELMSILVFVMPKLFEGRKDELKKVFSMFPKAEGNVESKGRYEQERIMQAKRIMAPFFLRRLKEDVLKDLPLKSEEVIHVPMSERQDSIYKDTIKILSQRAKEKKELLEEIKLQELDEISQLQADIKSPKKKNNVSSEDSSSNMLMTLRKMGNHPLLTRSLYTKEIIEEISKVLKKTTHKESVLDYIIEDLIYMSDFEIHKTCLSLEPIKKFKLEDVQITTSGKLKKLDEMLPVMKEAGDRVLIFSQFVIVLNILEDYLKIRGLSYRRLDGSTNVSDRQELIDDFNDDNEIFIFLLSTRAGGLGINLTAANVVILHDIDFNPYNDKQAEDRCHRVGQTKPVRIYRLISENTIEEGMHQIACNKLQLEKDVTGSHDSDHKKADVLALLKTALGVSTEVS